MAFTFQTHPQSQSAVPGQDTTFTALASSNDVSQLSAAYTYQWGTIVSNVSSVISGATSPTYTFDPLICDNGRGFYTTSTFLSGPGGSPSTVVRTITSNPAFLTVAEDVKPFDSYDVGPETGRQRHQRLRHLGYI
jgi:hypothetical protein